MFTKKLHTACKRTALAVALSLTMANGIQTDDNNPNQKDPVKQDQVLSQDGRTDEIDVVYNDDDLASHNLSDDNAPEDADEALALSNLDDNSSRNFPGIVADDIRNVDDYI